LHLGKLIFRLKVISKKARKAYEFCIKYWDKWQNWGNFLLLTLLWSILSEKCLMNAQQQISVQGN